MITFIALFAGSIILKLRKVGLNRVRSFGVETTFTILEGSLLIRSAVKLLFPQ